MVNASLMDKFTGCRWTKSRPALGLKKNQRYVIFDGPEQRGGPGTRYFSVGGTSTEVRYQAAKFFTVTDAIDFAKRNNIVIGTLHYVGIEDFNDLELQS